MSRADTSAQLKSGNYFAIANVLMQLRKVCNHPDLFEGRSIISSFDQMTPLTILAPSTVLNMSYSSSSRLDDSLWRSNACNALESFLHGAAPLLCVTKRTCTR